MGRNIVKLPYTFFFFFQIYLLREKILLLNICTSKCLLLTTITTSLFFYFDFFNLQCIYIYIYFSLLKVSFLFSQKRYVRKKLKKLKKK